MDANKTTIQITRDTWRHINSAKQKPRESMDKSLRRLLGLIPEEVFTEYEKHRKTLSKEAVNRLLLEDLEV